MNLLFLKPDMVAGNTYKIFKNYREKNNYDKNDWINHKWNVSGSRFGGMFARS